MTNNISKETYDRLYNIIGKPDEYLNGKICTYEILNQIDRYFLHNIDKEFIKDYFLIKDWVHFSFYNGSLFEKIFKEEIYTDIPLENLKLMWSAFNENKKEKNNKESRYYEEKRYQILPKFAKLVIKKSRKYNQEELLVFLKEIVINLNEDLEGYYRARNTASLMGEYLINNKEIRSDIFEFLKQQQTLKELDFSLIFYDWQLNKIHKKEKLDLIFKLWDELLPDIKKSEIIKEAINRKAFQIIKYIQTEYGYIFEEKELENIMTNEKGAYNKENVQYMIENFQPSRLVGRCFTKVYSEYRYSFKEGESEFYNQSVEFLKKKVAHDELQEKLREKDINNSPINIKPKIKKI